MLYFETQRACANSNSKKSHQRILKGLWIRKNAGDLLAELHPDLGRMELEAKCVLESAGDRDHPSEGLVQVPKPEHKVLLNSSQPQLERAGSLGRAVRRSSSLSSAGTQAGAGTAALHRSKIIGDSVIGGSFERPLLPLSLFWHISSLT